MNYLNREEAWMMRFQQLADYQRVHAHCNVPQQYEQNVELGRWVGKQREARIKGKLSEDREQKLNSIGFTWRVRNLHQSRLGSIKTDWDVRYEQLKEYKEEYGDCNVPQQFAQNIELGRW